MTVTVKVLIPPKQAEGTQTTQYTATNCKTIIDKFTKNWSKQKILALIKNPFAEFLPGYFFAVH